MNDVARPQVSVIIPYFNEVRFLSESIESVLSQSFSAWELLLVDDGSSDGSGDVAKRMAATDRRIRVLAHAGGANRGVCASRNLGIAEARADLVAFLDADDVWQPDKLGRQVQIFDRHPEVGMVVDGTEYWYDWSGGSRPNQFLPVGAPQDQVFGPGELMQHLYPLGTGTAPNPSALVIRRALVRELGGFEEAFTNEYQLYEDQAFLCKVYLSASTYVSSSYSVRYRQHGGSASARSREQYQQVRHYFLVWLERYIIEHGIAEERLDRLLKKSFLPYRSPLRYRLFHKGPRRLRELVSSLTGITEDPLP